MSFKEKSAWVMAVGLLLGGAVYFGALGKMVFDVGGLPAPSVALLITLSIAVVVFSVIGHVVLAAFSPKDANQASDERDRKVLTMAGHWSGNLLGVGTILALLIYLAMPVDGVLFYLVFASFWLSNLIEYLLQIYFYRSVI